LHFQRLHPHCYAVRHRSSCCQALWLSDQAAFTKEFVGTQECDNGLFALLGHHRDLDLAFFDIEDRICGVALCKKDFSLSVRGNCPALGGGRQKAAGSNRRTPASGLGAVSVFAIGDCSTIAAHNVCKIAHFASMSTSGCVPRHICSWPMAVNGMWHPMSATRES
jgi:hypothetical protein